MQNKKTAVLIPCYNEEKTIGKVIEDFQKVLPDAEIFVYDNNSTDDSLKIILEHQSSVQNRVFCVKYEIQGKGTVVQQMFADIHADQYLMVDADDTYPAEYAAALLNGLSDYDCDMVIGDRLSGNYYEDNKRRFHGFGNTLVWFLVNLLFHGRAVDIISQKVRWVPDIMTGYRAFSDRFVHGVYLESNGFEIETEMTIKALKGKYRIGTMPVRYLDRPEGSYSKLDTYSDGIKVLKTIFRLLFTKQERTDRTYGST